MQATGMADLAPYAADRRLQAVEADGRTLRLHWDDGRESRFHAVWLRDNCPCPECRHPQALERRFLLVDAPERIEIAAAEIADGDLAVRFAPLHASRFAAGWLRHHDYGEAARAERATRSRLWDASLADNIPTFDYTAVMGIGVGLRDWLAAWRDWGVARLRGIPARPGEGRRIAERIGPLRATNFGAVYDVVSMPNPNASAYTPMALEPHTDLANWRWPPDCQFLFCVANEAKGGGSILVDGFRVAEELRRTDPAAFRILSTAPIEFRFHDDDCDIRFRALSIELDGDDRVVQVRFNNWLRATFDLPEADIEPTYRALLSFWRLLRDSRFQIRPRLEAGEMLILDNHRVLHGRDPFDPHSGRRHLQGCYVDRDMVLSRLRVLERAS